MANTRAIIDVQINTSQAAGALRSLQTQLNAFQSALNTNNRVQANAAKNLAAELSEMVNAGGFFTAETVRMQTAASRLDKTLQKGQATIGQFWSAKFRKDSAEAASVLSLAQSRAAALQTQFVATGAAANGFRDALAIRPLHAFNSETLVSAERLAIHRAMLNQATTSMINFGKNTQWAGRQLMVGFTVPLTIFAATSGKAFREIEKELVNFRKVYGDAFTPPEEMERNLEAVQGLAKEYTKYGIAVKDTIGLAAQAAAAGAQNADLLDATTEATRLATLGQMEQNQALETTISLQTAFGLKSKDLTKTINFLNMVENQTVVTLQDLAEAIPRVAPVIKGLGGSVEDMAAMLAAMQEGGISAAQGANALKSGLASLINPTNRAIEKLEEMGINLNYIVQANRGDLMGTVQAFAQALATLDQFQQQQALEKVFGKYQYARLGALFNNIIKDGSQASRVMDTAALSASQLAASADKELGAIEESAATRFTAAMEKLKLAIAPVGEMFTEMAIPVLNFLGKLVEKFNELPDFAKKFIGFGTVITGIVIPAGTMFLGLLMNLVGTLVKFGSIVGIAFKGFASGGIKGAIKGVNQALKYMSLAEIDASTAAMQLGESTDFVNMALRDQPLAAGAASTAIDELAASYGILASRMMDAARASSANGGAFFVPGAAMTAAGRRGASNLAGRPLPIVARNKGGTIPGVGNRDSIPAMLTPGEFVVNKKATQENLHVLQAINSGREVKTLNGGGPSAMTAAMQRVLARVEAQRQEAATIPIAMGGRGPIRVTQSARSAVARGSRNIYDVLTGKYRKGDNVRVDTLRYAVEELGLSPEDLGLKTRGNFTFRMSDKSNLAMMRGTLTRDKLLEELYGSDVYSPLAKQLDSYLGLRLNASTFDRLYREEIGKLPATGITNGRFEKASRNALRRYLDEMNVPKGRRNSFLRDILQGDTVSSNASLTRIKDALDRRGISWQPGSSKKDIYVNINGRPVNLGNLAGREVGNLGRPSGILDFAGLGGSGQAVHANKGGMIMMNGGGRVFLGMPHKFSARNAEVRAALTRSNLEAQNGRFASMPVTDIGSMVQPIGGRSSNIPGLNGVYEVGGSKYVVKVHDTADSALAESRSSKLMRDIFGLTSPDQEVIKMRHPQTGDIVFAVRSPFDPRFAKSTGEIKKGSFAQQLIASAIRRDSDLQPDNVFGSIVADSGAAIFGMNDKGKPRASMPRIIGDNPIAARDQIDINLLRTKGGAKRFFAEASADIARSMTPDQYEKLIKKAIADARSRATAAVDSLPHMTQAERDKYLRTILGDLDDLDLVDWRAVHAHHKGILPEQKKAPTPAAIKKAEEAAAKKEQEEALRIRQKGANEGRPYGINWLNAGGIAVLLKNLKASRSAVSGARLLKPRSSGQPARSSRLVFEDYAYDAWGRSPWMRRNGRLVEAKGTRGSGWTEAISRGYVTQEEVEQIFYGPQSRVAAHGIDPQFLKRFKDLEMQGSYPAGTVESIFPMLSGAQGSYGPGQRGFEREKGFRAQLLPSTLVSTPKSFNTDIAKGIGTQAGIGELGGQHMISLMRFLMERGVDPTLARSILNDAARRLSSGLPNSGVTESGFYKAIAKAENGALMAHKDQLMASGITMNKGGIVGAGKNFYGRFNAKSVELFTRWISSQPYSIAEMKQGVVSDPALAKVFKGGFRRSSQKETLERSTWMTEMPKPGDSMALGALASFSPKGTPVLQHLADSKLRKDYEAAAMFLGMDQRSQKRDAANLKRIMDMGPENLPSYAPERRYYSPYDKTTGLEAYIRDTTMFIEHRKASIKKHKAAMREYKKYIPTIIELETPKGTIRANLDDIVPQANQQFMGRQTSEQERILHNAMIKVLDISEEDKGVRRIRAKLLSSAYPGFNAGGSVFDSSRGRRTVPGTGNTDTVPAVLTPGEFVVNKEAARKNMGILHAINSGKAIAPGYAVGSDVVDAGYIEEVGLGQWVHKNSDGSIRARYTSRSAAERALRLRKETLQREAQREQRKSQAARRTRRTRSTRTTATPEQKAMSMQSRMGVGMGMGAVGGALMMAPMIPGIGENATLSGIASGGGMALSLASMLPMLGVGGPLTLGIAAAGAGLVGLGLVIKNNMEAQDEAARKAAELGANLGGTSNALKKMADALGVATPAEKQAQIQLGLDDQALREAAAEFGDVIQGEGFQTMISELKEATSEERMTKLTDYLRNAVAAGMMKEEDARKLAKVIGLMLQDPAVGAGVATAIRGQATGPQAMLDIASQRAGALEADTAMQRMRSGQEFTESAGQEASKIIGGAFQVIQDAANAEALARQQFAEGLISYETYSNVIAEAEGLQKQYNVAIGEALQKTNDFGSTMQGVKDQLIKGGFLTEEEWTGIEETTTKAVEASAYTALADFATNPETAPAEIGITPVYNADTGTTDILQNIDPSEYQNYTFMAGNPLNIPAGSNVQETITSATAATANGPSPLSTMREDFFTAIMENPQGTANYSSLIKRMIGEQAEPALVDAYSRFAGQQRVTASEAFDATAIADQINRGLFGGVGTRDQNTGNATADQAASEQNVADRKLTVDVFTNFVNQGGDPATFQTFLLSIPDEKKMDVVTAFDDMGQADRESWMKDFNEIQTMLGPDSAGLATEITLSAKYQDADPAGRKNILNGIKEFDSLPSFVDKKAIYALETNDGKNPLSREDAERTSKVYAKIFKDMGSKNKAVRQRAELQLAARYNGAAVSPKQMNAIQKEYKNWDKLDVQSREEIISITFGIQSQFEVGGEFAGLGIDTSKGLQDMKKQIQARIDTLRAEIAGMQELEGTGEFDAAGLKAAQDKLVKYEDAMGVVTEGIRNAANIASGGPKGGTSGSGGGGGAKSIAEQLAEDLKMATDILKNLRNVIDTKGFKAFIAGPFAPEFLDYLRQQGEEGLKVLKGGLAKIKTEYEKFKKLRLAEIVTEATIAPMLRDQSLIQSFTSSAFRGQLMQAGLRGAEAESVMEQVPQEQLDALVALRQERRQILKGGVTGEEKKRLDEIDAGIKAITTNIKNAVAAAKELRILSELDSAVASITQAGEASSDFAQMLASGIDPTTAGIYQELGLSFDAINIKGKGAASAIARLTEAAKAMKIAESLRATIDGLNSMNEDLKLTQTLATQGFTGEFADELKALGITAFSTAEQINAAANGLKAMKFLQTLARTETEKLNISLENQNRALQAQIEAYQRNSIKPLEDQLQAINDVISAKQRDIEMEERKKEPYQKDIEALEEQKDKLREVYDQRIEALEKVAQINERIAQQEKNQLDIASALSRGDIAGAAQAALQAQQQAAQNRIDEARDALGQQYENDQLAIEDQIKGKKEEIKNIDEEIDRIQGDIRKKQDEAYNKQIEINNAKKEEAKMQEKMYKLQLLQSMAQTQADIRKAAQAGDTQAVGFLQQQLQSQLAIGGADQAAQEAFFNPVEGGRGVVQAAYGDIMGKSPGDLVAQAMTDILPTIDGFRNIIMQGFSLEAATDPTSSMPAALRQLVQSAYNTAEEFKNPATGLPYTVGEIVNVLGENGALGLLKPFVQETFDTSIKDMGTMLQKVSEKMVGIGSIVDDIVEGFRNIRARINEKIESAQAAIANLHNKITEANNTRIQTVVTAAPHEHMYGGTVKRAFGGNVNYKGSTEKAPGFMYGGKMKKFAYGSIVPGIGMTDKVPALLTPGEFVVRKSVAQEYGPLLTAINSNVFPKMNMSGAMPKNSSNSRDGIQYNYEVNVNVAGTNASPDEIANTVMYKIKRMDERQIRGTSVG